MLHKAAVGCRLWVCELQQRLYVQDLSEETQFMIAGRATPVKVAPGHEICAQGDPADCIWLLHEGT